MTRPCPICRQEDAGTIAFEVRDERNRVYTILKCASCRCRYLSPAPSPDILAEAYSDSYYGAGDAKFGSSLERVLDLFRMRRAALVARYVPGRQRILDVGCGSGRFLKFMLRHGEYELHGIELPGRAARRAAEIPQLKLKIGELTDGDFPAGYFDAVTLFHVLEHLHDPLSTLETASRVLRAGGVCVVSFPNIASLQARLFGRHWFHLDPPRHLCFPEPRDFVKRAAERGLVLERIAFASLEQNPFGAIQSCLNSFGGRRNLLYESLKNHGRASGRSLGWPLIAHLIMAALVLPVAVAADRIESLLGQGATVELVLRKR